MSEAAENLDSTLTEVVTGGVPKLWAGKYKTPEEMEEALTGKDKEFGKLYNEHGELKKQFEAKTAVPDVYIAPSDLSLRETELSEIKSIAKNANLTQEQFERTAREMASRIQSNLSAMETAKKEIGDEKLILIQDHIKKNYPESLQQTVLNQVIREKSAMNDILKERESKLNSEVPGMNNNAGQGTPQKFDGDKELKEAHDTYHKNPSERTRKRYIDLARQTGEERYKDKI